jgi:hypothetical protein
MRTTLLQSCLPVLCLLCVQAAAQVTPGAVLIGAQAVAGATVAPVPPSQTPIWPGLSRVAAGAAGASSFIVEHHADDLGIELEWQLATQAWQTGTTVSRVEVRYVFSSPVTQLGDLSIEWAPQQTGTGNSVLSVDVFDDGYVDANGAYTTPVAFHTFPLVLRVVAEVRADAGTIQGPWGSSWSWSGGAVANLRIRFTPTHASAAVVSPSTCFHAPVLTARPDLDGGVRLDAQAPLGDDLLVFVLGFAPSNLLLPWSAGCTLLVDPVVTSTSPLLGGPSASLSVPVPPAFRPAAFLTQAVSLDAQPLRLTAGDVVQVDVR